MNTLLNRDLVEAISEILVLHEGQGETEDASEGLRLLANLLQGASPEVKAAISEFAGLALHESSVPAEGLSPDEHVLYLQTEDMLALGLMLEVIGLSFSSVLSDPDLFSRALSLLSQSRFAPWRTLPGELNRDPAGAFLAGSLSRS